VSRVCLWRVLVGTLCTVEAAAVQTTSGDSLAVTDAIVAALRTQIPAHFRTNPQRVAIEVRPGAALGVRTWTRRVVSALEKADTSLIERTPIWTTSRMSMDVPTIRADTLVVFVDFRWCYAGVQEPRSASARYEYRFGKAGPRWQLVSAAAKGGGTGRCTRQ
jgi:hypothetical protein